MGNIPVLKPNEVVAILIKLGFIEVRQRGSHKQFRDSQGRCTTVPFHQGRDISPIGEAEARRLFGVLAEGGQVRMPLTKTFFSPAFGMLADRFGLSWMIYVTP